MLEQEMASIIKFILDSTAGPSPYYWKVPESFRVPAVYFPVPEIVSGADTLLTYSLDYAWYILFFAKNDNGAYALGSQALEAIRKKRNLIPLIDASGDDISGEYVRVNDPDARRLDGGVCQLSVTWRSRRPYDAEEAESMQGYEIIGWNR